MIRTCHKCSHIHPTATGEELEACPECGAIYSRVEAAFASKSARTPAVKPTATVRQSSAQADFPEEAVEPEGITQRQIIGFLGAAVLAIGVFMPLISGPFGMSANYFSNGQGDGVFILVMAICTAGLVFRRKYRLLWVAGGLSLVMLAITFVRVQSNFSKVKAQMEAGLAGNPFRGIADAAIASMQMQWGWVVLAIGALLILACAGMKKG